MDINLVKFIFKKLFSLTILFATFVALGQDVKDIETEKSPNNSLVSRPPFEVDDKTQEEFLKVELERGEIFLTIPSQFINSLMILKLGRQSYHVRWQLNGNRVFLTVPMVLSKAGNFIDQVDRRGNPTDQRMPSIVGFFPALPSGKKNCVKINITSFLLGERKLFEEQGAIPNYSFVKNIRNYPRTIEIQTVVTKQLPGASVPVSIEEQWSFGLLPEKTMEPRLFDHRMGFRKEEGLGYFQARPYPAAITRWRLEKEDPLKKMDNPVKPIIFYLDKRIPDKWKKPIKEGILSWLPAFEAAGFKDAIKVLDQPEGDSLWNVNDLRYSAVVWDERNRIRRDELRRTVEGGAGRVDDVIDLRSGEILKANIVLGPSFNWSDFLLRIGPLNEENFKYPLSEDVVGALIKELSAHEAGHAFGMMDGHYGEYAYDLGKSKSTMWLQTMGYTPSVMNYARHNYTAQPNDSLSLELLSPKVGPADVHHILWGYSSLNELWTKKQKDRFLDSIVRQQDKKKWLQFSHEGDVVGPDKTSEVIDNSDPIESTRLGLKNLERALELIPTISEKEPNTYLEEFLYLRLIDQWVLELKHVASLIGGFERQYKSGNQLGPVYEPIEAEDQRKATIFILNEVKGAPIFLYNRELTSRFEAEGSLRNISSAQNDVLEELLSVEKIQNMEEVNLVNVSTEVKKFDLEELLYHIHDVIWSPMCSEDGFDKVYIQELQWSYLFMLKNLIKSKKNPLTKPSRIDPDTDQSISAHSLAVITTELERIYHETIMLFQDENKNNNRGHFENVLDFIKGILDKPLLDEVR